MANRNAPTIEMSADGSFINAPKPSFGVILARLAAFGVLLFAAAVSFWFALFVIPVLIILGIVGYAVARFQLRRGGFVTYRRRF